MQPFRFDVNAASSRCPARTGVLHTLHGSLPTPAFMPVGSQATVKTVSPQELVDVGADIVLANAYHLYLRPGVEVIESLGGLHRFMGWRRPIITDSGGFQVFSLASLRKVDDDGVLFRSHVDGSEHYFTPELAVESQERLGADIIMVLDQCHRHDLDAEEARQAMERTHRWAARCRRRHAQREQALFGIVQGGMHVNLRRESARHLSSLGFPGYAIGGLSVGEAKDTTWEMVSETANALPSDRPRYLMGVGAPDDIVHAVGMGIDLFDSVLPTRAARHGGLYTAEGRLNVRSAPHRLRDGPVAPGCQCYTCRNFSAAYMNHLFKCEELLACRLATVHNLHFMMQLMGQIRDSIVQDRFDSFQKSFLGTYRAANDDVRREQKEKWSTRKSAR